MSSKNKLSSYGAEFMLQLGLHSFSVFLPSEDAKNCSGKINGAFDFSSLS